MTGQAPPILRATLPTLRELGWLPPALLGALLWVGVLPSLWEVWRTDDSLSHGPLVPLITAGYLWLRRGELRDWSAASPAGFAFLCFSSLLHLASSWADVEFVRPLSLVMMMAGTVWYLGGLPALRAAIGPLGFLVFMIPWPTTLVERISFPLRLISSSYSAMFAGMMGVPIVREGVQLAVVPDPDRPPIYSVLVAAECSGLTSLLVLLALGYLTAMHTRVALGWRALMLASVVPLALLMNSVRMTLILLAGAYSSEALAQWVHDHEAPVLIFFCSFALLGVRSALLAWTCPAPPPGGTLHVQAPPAGA